MNKKEVLDFYKHSTLEELMNKANNVCNENYGNKVFLRGLVEFSNFCRMDCLYCGIRNSNKKVQRYRLDENQIISIIKEGFKAGLKTFVLQSGEDDFYNIKKLTSIIEKIKKETDDNAAVTLSCGIKTKKEFRELKRAGCDRYLMRFETSDPALHEYLRNRIPLKKRLLALADLKKLGFEVGSGFMVGLPGESEETRINNAILCHDLELDMVGIGSPRPGTVSSSAKGSPASPHPSSPPPGGGRTWWPPR